MFPGNIFSTPLQFKVMYGWLFITYSVYLYVLILRPMGKHKAQAPQYLKYLLRSRRQIFAVFIVVAAAIVFVFILSRYFLFLPYHTTSNLTQGLYDILLINLLIT